MKFKAWICSKDAEYHIPDDYNGISIYFSKEALIAHKSCCTDDTRYGCTPVEIEIEIPDNEE